MIGLSEKELKTIGWSRQGLSPVLPSANAWERYRQRAVLAEHDVEHSSQLDPEPNRRREKKREDEGLRLKRRNLNAKGAVLT